MAALEARMATPTFWNDQEQARKFIDELKGLKHLV
jgi:hypothetical protein